VKLAGVVYLHDISLARMSGTNRVSLELLRGLCGDAALRSVVLCTTKWSNIDQNDGEMHYQELIDKYWRKLIARGSTVHKFDGFQKSAWEVVNLIVERRDATAEVLQIQRELVDVRKFIPDTEAGKKLKFHLHELQIGLRNASMENPSQREELETRISDIRQEIGAMHIPVTIRASAFFTAAIDAMLEKFSLISRDTDPPSDNIAPFVLRKNDILRDTDIVIA